MTRVGSLVLALVVSACTTDSAPGLRRVNDPKLALEFAQRSHRATVMLFGAEWDVASKRLDRAFTDASVQQLLEERFVAVRVDVSDDEAPGVKEVVETFEVRVPTVLVFDARGREVARRVGVLDVAELTALLRGQSPSAL